MLSNYEQYFHAMKSLGINPSVMMRRPGDWYVYLPGVEIGGNGMLTRVKGDGNSPATAITCAWQTIENLKAPLRIIINAMRNNRREVRWNGFMWEDVDAAG